MARSAREPIEEVQTDFSQPIGVFGDHRVTARGVFDDLRTGDRVGQGPGTLGRHDPVVARENDQGRADDVGKDRPEVEGLGAGEDVSQSLEPDDRKPVHETPAGRQLFPVSLDVGGRVDVADEEVLQGTTLATREDGVEDRVELLGAVEHVGCEAVDGRDGNGTPGDGCSPNCTVESYDCGNGLMEPGEECDDGNGTDTDACLNDCTAAT